MLIHFQIPTWISKVLTDAVSGIVVQGVIFLGRRFVKFIAKVIDYAKQRQKIDQAGLFSTYADLEELLGEFVEKYRDLARRTPSMSRWEFFSLIMRDMLGLLKGLTAIAVARLFGSDETRA